MLVANDAAVAAAFISVSVAAFLDAGRPAVFQLLRIFTAQQLGRK